MTGASIARRTRSGTLVGPGICRKWRPERVTRPPASESNTVPRSRRDHGRRRPRRRRGVRREDGENGITNGETGTNGASHGRALLTACGTGRPDRRRRHKDKSAKRSSGRLVLCLLLRSGRLRRPAARPNPSPPSTLIHVRSVRPRSPVSPFVDPFSPVPRYPPSSVSSRATSVSSSVATACTVPGWLRSTPARASSVIG